MRFDGSRVIEAPVAAVWYALRNPDTLEILIPRCARIERQPGYRPEASGDFTLSFESAAATQTPGANAIIGWLEVDRQRPPHHLALTLTLNDALTFMHIEGTIDLIARNQGRPPSYATTSTPVSRAARRRLSARPRRDQRLINGMLSELARLLGTTLEVGYANGYVAATNQPQVLLETGAAASCSYPPLRSPRPRRGCSAACSASNRAVPPASSACSPPPSRWAVPPSSLARSPLGAAHTAFRGVDPCTPRCPGERARHHGLGGVRRGGVTDRPAGASDGSGARAGTPAALARTARRRWVRGVQLWCVD